MLKGQKSPMHTGGVQVQFKSAIITTNNPKHKHFIMFVCVGSNQFGVAQESITYSSVSKQICE